MFPSFTKLPPELREVIWLHALDRGWSYSYFRRGTRRRPGIKLIGNIYRSRVGDACCESRAVMKLIYVWTERYGWINFNKHLFFFRDDKFDGSILNQIGEKQGLLGHVQHIALYPREWWRTTDTFNLLVKNCQQLRTVIVIAPFMDLFKPGWKEEIEFAPYEDFGPIFRKSPAELDLIELFEAIDGDYAIELDRRDHYKARLDEYMVHVREVFDDEEDSYWWMVRDLVHRFERDMSKFSVPPRLFLRRRRDDLCPSELVHPF